MDFHFCCVILNLNLKILLTFNPVKPNPVNPVIFYPMLL